MLEPCRAQGAEAGVTPAVVSTVAGDKLQWSIFIIQYTINNKGLHHLQHSHLHFWFCSFGLLLLIAANLKDLCP